MLKLLSPAISRIARLRLTALDQWIQYPIEAQRDVMQNLITAAQYTQFGIKYGLSKTFSIKAFKQAVPIHEYAQLQPLIESMMEGEENVLWNTPIEWFAKSSGTTSSRSKFIPVSQESLDENHFQASKDVLTLYYRNYPESDLLTGKGLVIGGSHQVANYNDSVKYGDLSAVLLQNTPFWGHWLRTPELSIALMEEWETKIESLANTTITEDVTSLSGVPTWAIVLIKRILEKTGKQTLGEVWKNLELYFHGGVSFIPYRQQFEKLVGKQIRYLEMYNASEGFFAAQTHETENGMLLFLNHGIFYEFMPVDEYGKPNPQTIGLKDVEIGKNYAPVISTTGGLWRYIVGDTIQFTTTYPFRIKVSGRLKHFINAFGEELIIDNADNAIQIACEKTNSLVSDYTAAPVYFNDHSNGAHEWLIEFEKAPLNIEAFKYELDNALRNINSDYDAKRHKDIALSMLQLVVLKHGTFNEWLKQKGKLGGQHKVPRLSNNREFIDEIKAFL
jgi:hypothetical protein